MSHVNEQGMRLGTIEPRSEILALTSLRGVAALGVVIFHFRDQFGSAIDLDKYTVFFSRGYLLVDFFFVLSGFVIALSYTHFFAGGFSANKYGVFLAKRLGRIYPLHIVVLAGFVLSEAAKYLVATSANPPFSVNTFNALIANILLIQAWGIFDHFTWNHPAWSISTEWFAYLIFPFLAAALSKARSYTAIGVVVAACLAELACLERYTGGDTPVSLFLLRCIPSFVLGMVVYRLGLFMPHRMQEILASNSAFATSLLPAVVTIALPVSDVVAIGAFFLTVLTGSVSRGRVAAALSKGPLYFLGIISYSIYLVHTLLQRVWQMLFQVVWHSHIGTAEAWIVFFVLVSAVIAVSKITYDLIEKPGRDMVSKRIVPLMRPRLNSPKPG